MKEIIEIQGYKDKNVTSEPLSAAYNMDCVAFMKQLPDNYFDLACADPNYGIGIAANPVRQAHERKDWDNKTPDKEFFDELFRVSKNQIIWGGNYFGLPPNKHFLIWDKVQPFDFTLAMCEYAWSSFDKPAKMFRYRVQTEKNKIHCCQKPIELYAWILKHYAKEGELIFDPMMGSQSSRIAAYKMGFDFVGGELEPLYFNKGNERFERLCKGVIVESNGAKVVQQELF